jgi:hypothetical protein
MTLTFTERDCLVRSTGQGGRFWPQPQLDSASAYVVLRSLQRKGFVTNGPSDCPCLTDAGVQAITLTRGKTLPEH